MDNTNILHLDASLHMHHLVAFAEAAGCNLKALPDSSLRLEARDLHPSVTHLTDQELIRHLQARIYLAPLVKELVGRLENACDRIIETQDLYNEALAKWADQHTHIGELEDQIETQREIIAQREAEGVA